MNKQTKTSLLGTLLREHGLYTQSKATHIEDFAKEAGIEILGRVRMSKGYGFVVRESEARAAIETWINTRAASEAAKAPVSSEPADYRWDRLEDRLAGQEAAVDALDQHVLTLIKANNILADRLQYMMQELGVRPQPALSVSETAA